MVDEGSVVSSLPVGTDECGLYDIQYQPDSAPDDDKPRVETQLTPTINSLLKNKVERNAELENSNPELPGSVKPRNIEDARLCKICYCAEMGCVLTPCGHVVACIEDKQLRVVSKKYRMDNARLPRVNKKNKKK